MCIYSLVIVAALFVFHVLFVSFSQHINQPLYHVELAHFGVIRRKNQINYFFIAIRITPICNKQAAKINTRTRKKAAAEEK